jgi:predicted NUDIX family phosphoesterase
LRAAEGFFKEASEIYMKFINCALEIEKEFISRSNKKDITFKWFIASDSEKVKELIIGYSREKAFMFNDTIGANKDKFRLAVLDVELLSKCDEIIVTSGSTFGWLAAMKTLKMPYYVSGSSEKMVKCTREDMRYPSVNPRSTASF